jgi:hypothetical protein
VRRLSYFRFGYDVPQDSYCGQVFSALHDV